MSGGKRKYFLLGANVMLLAVMAYMWTTLMIFEAAGVPTWVERFIEAPAFIAASVITIIYDVKEMAKALRE